MKLNPAYWILESIMMNGFLMIGWSGDGSIHRVGLILGGIVAGHLLTEMLNYSEEVQE